MLDCNANGRRFVAGGKDLISPRYRRADGVVEHAEVTAQFSGDTPDNANVFADEFAGRVDEGRDGSAGGDDIQHATGRAAMRKRVEQRRLRHAEPRAQLDSAREQSDMRRE